MHTANNELELIELNERAREFLLLEVNENQRNLVASVAQSFADALFPPADYENGAPLPWIRGVLLNSEPVAFIMCADPTAQQKDPWLWRLLVDKSYQRCGIGKFAVKSVLARYREMGCARVLVCWAPTEGNAGDFIRRLDLSKQAKKWVKRSSQNSNFRNKEESPYKPEILWLCVMLRSKNRIALISAPKD